LKQSSIVFDINEDVNMSEKLRSENSQPDKNVLKLFFLLVLIRRDKKLSFCVVVVAAAAADVF